MRSVFLLAAVPAAATVGVLLLAVREGRRGAGGASESMPPRQPFFSDLGTPYRRLLLALVVFTLGNSTDAFLLLRLHDAGLAAGWVAALWSAHHVMKISTSWVGGAWSDRRGRRAPVLAGWAVYAAVYLGFAATSGLPGLVVLFLLYGLYFGLTEPVEKAWVVDLAPAGRRGTALGLYHGAVGLAALPASLLFGLLWSGFGAPVAFGTGAVLAVVAGLLLLRLPSRPATSVAA
jgi:MFS family permease